MTIDTSYHLDQTVRSMHTRTKSAGTVVHLEVPALTPAEKASDDALARIRERGSLKFGYDPSNLPMSFFNDGGELVGFEVELSERLAKSLDLRAEFVPVVWSEVPRMLRTGEIDVMPGMWYRPYWFDSIRMSDPYFVATVGLAVRDERRNDFNTLKKIKNSHGLKIGVPLNTSQIKYSLDHYFGGTDAEFITIEFWQPFFEGLHPEVDAFLMPAEHAAAWSLLHPEYTVVVPQPNPVKIPTAFGVGMKSDGLAMVIDEWIVYATNAGIIDQDFNYWVMGKGASSPEPRWSIMRNVLGWGN